MTLEGEGVLGVGGVDILDGHPPLYAAQCKPCGQAGLLVQKYADTSMLREDRNHTSKIKNVFEVHYLIQSGVSREDVAQLVECQTGTPPMQDSIPWCG